MPAKLGARPTLGVVIPNRNDEVFLGDCLRSVLNQTTPPDEIIFVDDCSSDNSFSLARQLLGSENGVKLIRSDEHIGTMRALNLGLAKVTSDYVLFLSSNDYLENRIFESAKDSIVKEGETVGVWSAMVLKDDPNVAGLRAHASARLSNSTRLFSSTECISHLNRLGNWFTGTTMFFNTEKLKDISGFDPRFMGLADLFAAMILASKYGAIFSPQFHGVMRVHQGGLLSETLENDEIFPMIAIAGKALSPDLFTEKYIDRMRSRLAYTIKIKKIKLGATHGPMRSVNRISNWYMRNGYLNRAMAFIYFLRFRPYDFWPFIRFRLYPAFIDWLSTRPE